MPTTKAEKMYSLAQAQMLWLRGERITHVAYDDRYWFVRTEDGLTWDSNQKKIDPAWSSVTERGWQLHQEHIPQPRMDDESLLPGWAVGYCYCGSVNNTAWIYYSIEPTIDRKHECWEFSIHGYRGEIPDEHAPQDIPDGFNWRDSRVPVKKRTQ